MPRYRCHKISLNRLLALISDTIAFGFGMNMCNLNQGSQSVGQSLPRLATPLIWCLLFYASKQATKQVSEGSRHARALSMESQSLKTSPSSAAMKMKFERPARQRKGGGAGALAGSKMMALRGSGAFVLQVGILLSIRSGWLKSAEDGEQSKSRSSRPIHSARMVALRECSTVDFLPVCLLEVWATASRAPRFPWHVCMHACNQSFGK